MALLLCRNAAGLRHEGPSCGRTSRRHTRPEVLSRNEAVEVTAECKVTGTRVGPDSAIQKACILDVESFSHFAPLLEACQDYALVTGCRFHGLSYEARSLELLRGSLSEGDFILSTSGDVSLDRLGPTLMAEINAAPVVLEFMQRLRSEEPELLADINRAIDIMMAEGVRNSLRVTCQQLGLWPPRPTPPGIEASDCFYFDAQADVPVVAQRLFNDERRRAHVLASAGGENLEHKLAATASFLVDFAYEAGISMPTMPPKYDAFLREFAVNVGIWEKRARGHAGYGQATTECSADEQHAADWTATDITEAAALVRSDIKQWLQRTLQIPRLGTHGS